MQIKRVLIIALVSCAALIWAPHINADNLYKDSNWAGLASDLKASQPGDILEVVVYQNAESLNSSRKTSRKQSNFEGGIRGGSLSESGDLSFGGGYSGQGEIRRRESLMVRMSLEITQVLPSGDYIISGHQNMYVNGEETRIEVRGRIRPVDINARNQILSSRIANAEINYNGSGFVSRSTKPGLINRLFNALGLGL